MGDLRHQQLQDFQLAKLQPRVSGKSLFRQVECRQARTRQIQFRLEAVTVAEGCAGIAVDAVFAKCESDSGVAVVELLDLALQQRVEQRAAGGSQFDFAAQPVGRVQVQARAGAEASVDLDFVLQPAAQEIGDGEIISIQREIARPAASRIQPRFAAGLYAAASQ